MCRVCGLCKTCSDPRNPHDCPYPNCDEYHKCSKKLLTAPRTMNRKRVAKLAKSARELEAVASENDMKTDVEKGLNTGSVPDSTVEDEKHEL